LLSEQFEHMYGFGVKGEPIRTHIRPGHGERAQKTPREPWHGAAAGSDAQGRGIVRAGGRPAGAAGVESARPGRAG